MTIHAPANHLFNVIEVGYMGEVQGADDLANICETIVLHVQTIVLQDVRQGLA